MAKIKKCAQEKVILKNLKADFEQYMNDKVLFSAEDSGIEKNKQNTCILLNGKEFKEYLTKELGIKESALSMSIESALEYIINGSLFEEEDSKIKKEEITNELENAGAMAEVSEMQDDEYQTEIPENEDMTPDEYETDEEETNVIGETLKETFKDEKVIKQLDKDNNGNLSEEEMAAFIKTVASLDGEEKDLSIDDITQGLKSIYDEEYDNLIKNRLLDELFDNEKVIELFDADKDGKLSYEEKEAFKDFIKGYNSDNHEGELSLDDIESAYNDISNNNFEYDPKKIETTGMNDESNVSDSTYSTSQIQSPASYSGSGSYGGGNYSNRGASIQASAQKTLSLDELKQKKQEKESELNVIQDEMSSVNNGDDDKVKAAQEDYDEKELQYQKDLDEDEQLKDVEYNGKPIKEAIKENLGKIDEANKNINTAKNEVNELNSNISKKESEISLTEANISGLEAALASYSNMDANDEEAKKGKQAADEALVKAQEQLKTQKEELKKLNDALKLKEEELKGYEDSLKDAETEKENLDKLVEESASEKTKLALEAYNKAKTNLETTKETRRQEVQQKIDAKKAEIKELDEKINEKEKAKTEKEYKLNAYDFDFDLKLSDIQANDIESFKSNFEQNKDKYEAVAQATGVPAELIAALHWRESTGRFDTYLHNGDPLGSPTTHVPAGIYFNDWTDAAIDALKNHGGDISSIDNNDINTWYDYAERYNGLGYRYKGVLSPYVWAGTDKYTGGKYVADGVYDPNHYDQQLGVAVMLQALLS